MIDKYKIYSAPLQGYTDNVWRNAHQQIFGSVDTYYAPFMCIDHGTIRKRDINDLNPDNNTVTDLVPQILCCLPEEGLTLVERITDLGYNHININLGCPHPPVVKKHKGAGLMNYLDEMEKLFTALSNINTVTYSIKMRLGWDNETQWQDVMELFSIIQPKEVIIHPRLGIQQYTGEVNMDQLSEFTTRCPYPVVYNGNISQPSDITTLATKHPQLQGFMIGRGLIANPHMLAPETKTNLGLFHECLISGYGERLNGGEHQILMKMKSLWEIFLPQADRKARKAIKKSHNMQQYLAAANEAIESVVSI